MALKNKLTAFFLSEKACYMLKRKNCITEYGEPQAYIRLPNGRYIEITREMHLLKKEEYFYSLRLHCSEMEFGRNYFDSVGILRTYLCKEKSEFRKYIKLLLVQNKEIKVF